MLTLENADAAVIGAFAARRRHRHHIPFDVEQEITEIDPDIDLVRRVCEGGRVHIRLVDVPEIDLVVCA